MKRKVKLTLLALLGFSTACSTVRRAPVKSGAEDTIVRAYGSDSTRRVIVMYEVRSPEADSVRWQKTMELRQVDAPSADRKKGFRSVKGKE